MPLSLKSRARLLRLTNKALSEIADLDKNTVGAVLNNGRGLIRSSSLIEKAIEREELSLLDHLVSLHPGHARVRLTASVEAGAGC